jgi:hypothetical protein
MSTGTVISGSTNLFLPDWVSSDVASLVSFGSAIPLSLLASAVLVKSSSPPHKYVLYLMLNGAGGTTEIIDLETTMRRRWRQILQLNNSN